MIKYSISSQNLNNSLVFYRALLGKMPDYLGLNFLSFSTDQFHLEIMEGTQQPQEVLTMKVLEKDELKRISKRIRRFRLTERLKSNCEVLDKTIGLIDPDGNRWRIGDPKEEVQFEKCYVTT